MPINFHPSKSDSQIIQEITWTWTYIILCFKINVFNYLFTCLTILHLDPHGPVVSTLRPISLLRVGEQVLFRWDPGRCMSFSCVVKISCDYPAYSDVLCYFRRGFISRLLCQAYKSDCMFNKYQIPKNTESSAIRKMYLRKQFCLLKCKCSLLWSQ